MATEGFLIFVCPTCDSVFIKKRGNKTVLCGSCDSTHNARTLKVHATADTRIEAIRRSTELSKERQRDLSPKVSTFDISIDDKRDLTTIDNTSGTSQKHPKEKILDIITEQGPLHQNELVSIMADAGYSRESVQDIVPRLLNHGLLFKNYDGQLNTT